MSLAWSTQPSKQQAQLHKAVIGITRDDPFLSKPMANVISIVFANLPAPRVETALRFARAVSPIPQIGVAQELLAASFYCAGELPRPARLEVAREMVCGSVPQRQISRITKLGRATVRNLMLEHRADTRK